MENSYHRHASVSASSSRPSLGFPLGTALLLLVVFTLSGTVSCCYHCHKSRRRRRQASDQEAYPSPLHLVKQKLQNDKGGLSVIMPGDEVPKFLALPCPCEPPRRQGNIAAAAPHSFLFK